MFSFAFVVCLVLILIIKCQQTYTADSVVVDRRINSRKATFLTFGEGGGREEFFNFVYFSSCPIA